MSSVSGKGRLGNIITRNIAGSIIAKKHDLKMRYQTYISDDLISNIGILLFNGNKVHQRNIVVNDNNYCRVLNKDSIDYNIDITSYCQTKQISDGIHKYLNSDEHIKHFLNNNKYKDRYHNNNDCFVHIRLGDVERWNPGFNYYDFVLSKIRCDNIYIATDSNNHDIIKKIQKKYRNVNIMDDDMIKIFQFAPTCRYVILSYGTFSAIIGYLSYYSTVYCLKFCKRIAWDWHARDECDMFRNKATKICNWIEIGG